MTPSRELLMIAQRHADEAAREAGAEFGVVLIAKGDTVVVGAWCPHAAVIRDLLRQALQEMDAGEAIHVASGGQPS